MKVLLAAGGTAGHINPAIAIADAIKAHQPDAEILFAGTPNGM
ncbi:MAG: glycosyltransferase, partial [Massilioclostridium sp.]|nr:glycosyltransferase [Massilioclostridium sp.]